jgi:predicted membrane protein
MKIKKDSVRILEPYAVFFIIVGLGIGIFVPVITTFWKVSDETKAMMVKLIWLVAAFCGLAYSLIVLRYLIRQSVLNRLLYFIMVIIFVTLTVITFLLS